MKTIEDDYVFVDRTEAEFDLSTPYLPLINDFVDSISDKLWHINTSIHDNPELAYHEYKAHDLLTTFLESLGHWKVTRSAYRIETAFVAVSDSGRTGPVVSFNAEYDALPNIGHACGHNLIASASLAGALATAHIMHTHSLSGKVILYGTPAEEGGAGKTRLLKAGAYSSHKVDISLISHPGTVPDVALMSTAAYLRFKAEFFGRASHAAANPWLGINALDALVLAYNGISVLRQQTMPGDVLSAQITDGGLASNIIHPYAAGVFVVRANTQSRLEELRVRVNHCFEGAALATGATLKITEEISTKDHVPNHALGRAYRTHFNALGGSIPGPEIDEIRGRTMASTDQGDISHAMPSLSPGFWIRPGKEGNGPHSPDFADAAATREAFELSLRVGKGLAGTAVDVLTKPELLKEVKEEFAKRVKDE